MNDNNENTKVKALIETSLSKIHELSDADTVIGEAIQVGNITIIPVSKVSYGFAAGGSDLPTKSDKTYFGGGSGAGITILPLCFLVVNGSEVKMLQITEEQSGAAGAIAAIPELIGKIKDMFSKKKKDEDKPTDDEIFNDE
ncbi:MAG: GerW family sporulation protein [Ruminococcus sp.]|jgi:sporulation protein YtfJ|nr:GerW family sporulation protein [Ruminococcus sp.]